MGEPAVMTSAEQTAARQLAQGILERIRCDEPLLNEDERADVENVIWRLAAELDRLRLENESLGIVASHRDALRAELEQLRVMLAASSNPPGTEVPRV